jgi:hypothetical protein
LQPGLKKAQLSPLHYPDSAFFGTAAVFLLALPFTESGISILFGRMLGQTGKWGFSGVVFALYAYFLFLVLLVFYDNAMIRSGTLHDDNQPRSTQEEFHGGNSGSYKKTPEILKIPETRGIKPTKTAFVLSLIYISTLVIVLPLFFIFLEIGNKKMGVFGHVSGFALGFLIASLIALICETPDKRSRAILAIMLGLIIAVPALALMVV